MGDTVEFTTWPRNQNAWYRVTSSAVRFQIKSSGSATMGLASTPDSNQIGYWIGIGEGNRLSYIRGEVRETRKEEITPHILSDTEFRAFWLSWRNNTITLGREDSDATVVALTSKNKNDTSIQDMKYITFGIGRQGTVHWRLEVPPKFPPAISRPISGGRLHWRPAADQLPDGALIGGFERETLYIMRMKHRSSLIPGKYVGGMGFIPWYGEPSVIVGPAYEVLCGYNGIWIPTSRDRIPNGAFEGGYSEVSYERIYIGRAYHDGCLIPGHVRPACKNLKICYKGQQVFKDKYEILVDPQLDPRCVDRYIPLTASCDVNSEEDDRSETSEHSAEDYLDGIGLF